MAENDGAGGADGRSPYLGIVSDATRAQRKQFAPSAGRNIPPILAVLRDALPARGRALEVASGTGQHVAAFAAAHPGIDWQPSDPTPESRDSIAAWAAEAGQANIAPPLALDMLHPAWEAQLDGGLDAMVCINMIHISPWAACEGLLRGAGALLAAGGLLYLYGPYRRDGAHTAASNEAFDASLRARDPQWGIRDMETVAAAADAQGLGWERTVDMPANNFSLLFRKRPD